MDKAEHNFRLLQEIEENRRFLLQVYAQNPELLKTADARIRPLLAPLPIEKSAALTAQRGISLIELIMFIVIVSTALAGILLVFNVTTKGSADPLIHKQALAAAESLLEEIQLQDFSNPPDGGFGGEKIQANRWQFDDVMDYNGFATSGIFPISGGTAVSGLESYNVSAAVSGVALDNITLESGSAVLITVTVTVPQGTQIEISGYRTAY